jgi:hypothetical protein
VSDVSELFGAPGNFCLEKSVLGKIRFHARNETVHVQDLRRQTVIRARLCGRNQTCAGIKQRPLAIPVALLSSRSGDHVVRRGDNRVNRLHIACYCFTFHIKASSGEDRIEPVKHLLKKDLACARLAVFAGAFVCRKKHIFFGTS